MQLILFGASNAVMPFIKKGILAFFNVFLLLSLLVISVAAWRVHASELHIDERFDIAVINHPRILMCFILPKRFLPPCR